MKKYIVLIFCLSFIASCWPSQEAIDKAKQDMLNSNSGGILAAYTGDTLPSSPTADIEDTATWDLLQINPIDESQISAQEVQISWKVLAPDVEKIIVNFRNPTSSFPSDQYTLQTFHKWDTEFHYIASSGFKVLDFGQNEYTFVAYGSGRISESKVIINVPENFGTDSWTSQVDSTWVTTQNQTDVLTQLPKSVTYGNPMLLTNTSFTYSDLRWFIANKDLVPSISCDDAQWLTDYLIKKYSYNYWNTCRDIISGKSIRVNVVRLTSSNTFVYETHVLDSYNQLHGVYSLTSWSGTKDTIEQENQKLKSQNFPWITPLTELFSDIDK